MKYHEEKKTFGKKLDGATNKVLQPHQIYIVLSDIKLPKKFQVNFVDELDAAATKSLKKTTLTDKERLVLRLKNSLRTILLWGDNLSHLMMFQRPETTLSDVVNQLEDNKYHFETKYLLNNNPLLFADRPTGPTQSGGGGQNNAAGALSWKEAVFPLVRGAQNIRVNSRFVSTYLKKLDQNYIDNTFHLLYKEMLEELCEREKVMRAMVMDVKTKLIYALETAKHNEISLTDVSNKLKRQEKHRHILQFIEANRLAVCIQTAKMASVTSKRYKRPSQPSKSHGAAFLETARMKMLRR